MNLDHPANCLTFNLQRASRSLVRGFEDAVREFGLTAPQFSTLAQLSAQPERSVGDLAEAMGTDRTTLTRNLDLMAAKGWIEIAVAGDRRLRVWRLSDAGRRCLDAARPAWRGWQAALVDRLGEDATRGLLTSLQKL